jgi:hypothetical protein
VTILNVSITPERVLALTDTRAFIVSTGEPVTASKVLPLIALPALLAIAAGRSLALVA